jgi:RNA polymerase primary sigma factor
MATQTPRDSRAHPSALLAVRLRVSETDLAQLVSAHQGFVAKLAREYGHLGVPIEDLINEGNIGLLQAARRFDRLRGTRFLTYAAAWIRKQILSALEHHMRLVRLPAYRLRTLRRLLSAEQTLSQRLGRCPDREELRLQMDARRGEVERIQQCRYREVSIDGDPDAVAPVGRTLQDPETLSPEEELLRDETYRLVHGALAILTSRERTILMDRYGLHDGRMRTLREVASGLSLSRERVRQIESSARMKIARHLACRKKFVDGTARH